MKKLLLVLAFTVTCMVTNAQGTFTVDPNYNHSISLSDAQKLTHKFHATYPSLNQGSMFSKTYLLAVLNQEGCVAIRFYYAIGDNDMLTLCGVGVRADNTEITNGVIIERAMCCYYNNCFPCQAGWN